MGTKASTTTKKDQPNVAPTGRESTGKETSQGKNASAAEEQRQSQEEVDPHPAGTKLGHYVIGKSLGKGTFGKVKMAEHILTKESVAIKILEKARIKDRKDIDRISREIKILKKVRHPNVIQLYEIIETETELYLIMEYCVNGELFDYIVQHQRLHEKAAIRIFQQLVSGIEYIHKSGICHRDLKPENLLLDFDKTLKIVDFGLSNIYEPPDGLLKTACGSPCYAAPEMIAGKKYLGLKSDIWSSGVVLYAMVCGFLPFEDPKTSNLYKKIMAGEFKIPRFLSTDCSHFISKILQTEPSERYGIEQIREHPWYRQFRDKQPSGLFPGHEVMPLEDSIYEQILDEFGFDPDYSVKCIEANRHNNITATYHLLYKKAQRKRKPFTNVSHVTGSLDRAAVAQYERMEAAKAQNERHPRHGVGNDWQSRAAGGDPSSHIVQAVLAGSSVNHPQHKRGTSTNYNNYKNANVLQSVNGGPETANLKPDQAVAISAQKRYKMELQAEISRLRDRYSQATQANKKPKEAAQPQGLIDHTGSQKKTTGVWQDVPQQQPAATKMTTVGARYTTNQKRTERHQHSRHRGTITDNSEKTSPDTNPKRPQNRVNIVQIQNQQQQQAPQQEEVKQGSQVIGLVPQNQVAMVGMLPTKTQKQVKQYSSQPGKQQPNNFSDKAEEIGEENDEYVFNGSEIEDVVLLHEPKAEDQQDFDQDGEKTAPKPVQQAFQSLEDESAQKVSTFSSLTNAAATNKSVNDQSIQNTQNQTKRSSKGSNVLRSHIKKKRSEAAQPDSAIKEEFLNSSMPIHLPTQQVVEPFVRAVAKSGGRKLANTSATGGAATGGGPPMLINHQMRYRQQKTSSSNGGNGSVVTGELGGNQTQQFNTLGGYEPSDQIAIQMNIRSKKNQQYVSLNANTQNLMNNSLDLSSQAAPNNTTYSTIAAGQSSKNVAQISMNQRQIDHLANNLNKTQNVRQSTKQSGTKYNINRASLGGIIGHQKHMQAQRIKQGSQVPPASKQSNSNIMPSIHETVNLENLSLMHQHHNNIRQSSHQHPGVKHHRQSFKQTVGQAAQLINQEASPVNQASILARRAGSQQWRNNSQLSNKGGRDSVNSNHSAQQQVNALFQSNSGKRTGNTGGGSQIHVAQHHQPTQFPATVSAGDYDFTTVDTMNHPKHQHPARIITSSESGQVGLSNKPLLQLSHMNNAANFVGQTSENQMNLHAANTIDFHQVGSNPQSNSRIYHIQQTSTGGGSNIVGINNNNNKVQQLKNRKGINQSIQSSGSHHNHHSQFNNSIDIKPTQVQQIKQGLRASSQLGPQSQVSRKNAQSRQFAFESDLSNNYASQISGWVNQSILPHHQQVQQAEMLDQSAASLKSRIRQGKQHSVQPDGGGNSVSGLNNSALNASALSHQQVQQTMQHQPQTSSNYAMQQIYAAGPQFHHHGGPGVGNNKSASINAMAAQQQQAKIGKGPAARLVHSVMDTHHSGVGLDSSQLQLMEKAQQQLENAAAASATATNINNPTIRTKTKSQVKKSRIEIPQSLIQKQGTHVRTTPVQNNKTSNNFSGQGFRSTNQKTAQQQSHLK